MKIYNEVVTIFNENTGLWETISEDSFDYSGPLALAQGPPFSTPILAVDTVADTVKTTAGYFSNGDGTFPPYSVHTGSLEAENQKYYFTITNGSGSHSEVQFSVAYGDIRGSGSNQYGDSTDDPTTLIGTTQAIYKQFTNLLLEESEATGGFHISAYAEGSGVKSTNTRDNYVYILIGKRDRFKDRINKKAWTLTLSGSDTYGNGKSISLTDDSKNVTAVATPAGPRYNIVSGTLGNPTINAADRCYGWFWPERGVFVFSGCELSASIPGGPHYGSHMVGSVSASLGSHYFSGSHNADFSSLTIGDAVQITSGSGDELKIFRTMVVSASTAGGFSGSAPWPHAFDSAVAGSGSLVTLGTSTTNITASFAVGGNFGTRASSSGFAPNLTARGNPQNAIRFINCLRNNSGHNIITMRSEEDATQENYFCRVRSNDYNFSSNPTWVSGSFNKIRHTNMIGNPTTFITGVGLYNSAGQLLAIASLSKPIIKNFASEATIKVKLTY